MQTIVADEQQRVRLPDAKPGQVFSYEADATGSIITLHEMRKNELEVEILEFQDLDQHTLCPKEPDEVIRESLIGAIRDDRESQC